MSSFLSMSSFGASSHDTSSCEETEAVSSVKAGVAGMECVPNLVDCDEGKRAVLVPDEPACGAEANRFVRVDDTADPLTSLLRTLRRSRFCAFTRGRVPIANVAIGLKGGAPFDSRAGYFRILVGRGVGSFSLS